MPLSRGAIVNILDVSKPVSYKVDVTDKLRDCRNIYTKSNRIQTRHGISKYNSTSLGGAVLSVSFFKKTDGTPYVIAKVGTSLYSVAATGAHTEIKSGLSATTKHRAVSLNDRHIICIESDGLFAYDGTTFTQLGQAPPAAPTAVLAAGGSLADATYQVAITYYISSIGFESNIGAASGSITTSGANNSIDVSAIASTAANGFVDKVRIYIKDVTAAGNWLFWAEQNLGITTDTIDADPSSSQVPPTKNAAPQSGGGKYLTKFGMKLAYTGSSSFPNDVFLSEENLPDAYDDDASTQTVLVVPGNGEITGIAQGLFNDSLLDPYLVMFKKTSTHIYSELGGSARFATINEHIGCVSHDTIKEKNGVIYFMSNQGWHAIVNGRLAVDSGGDPIKIDDGDLDDIFTESGYNYELNRAQFGNFFSVYYAELDQYLTFVSEGSNNSIFKAYNYEFGETNGFRPYEFQIPLKCATEGEDSSGNEVVFLGDDAGYLYTHSTQETRTDLDASGNDYDIDAFLMLYWYSGNDNDASYNFRELIAKALTNSNDITVKTFINYDIQERIDFAYSFPDPISGFQLDVSRLDEGVFSDGRSMVTARADVNRVGENMLIGFYQRATDSNMNLMKAQLHVSKNGNRN